VGIRTNAAKIAQVITPALHKRQNSRRNSRFSVMVFETSEKPKSLTQSGVESKHSLMMSRINSLVGYGPARRRGSAEVQNARGKADCGEKEHKHKRQSVQPFSKADIGLWVVSGSAVTKVRLCYRFYWPRFEAATCGV
jgi:hypothetical protein